MVPSDEAMMLRINRKRRRSAPLATMSVLAVATTIIISCSVVQLVAAFTAVGNNGILQFHKGEKESAATREWGSSLLSLSLTACDCDTTAERKKEFVKWDEWENTSRASLESTDCSADSAPTSLVEEGRDEADAQLPPWLSRHYKKTSPREGTNALLTEKLKWIEHTLVEQEQWSWENAHQVIQTMYTFANSSSCPSGDNNEAVILGMTDFLTTLLETTTTATASTSTIEKETVVKLKQVVAEQVSKRRAEQTTSSEKASSSPFVTKEILLASIWHYAESIAARKQGLLSNDFVRRNVLFSGSSLEQQRRSSTSNDVPRHLPLPESSSKQNNDNDEPIQVVSALSSKMMISILHSVETVTQFQPYRPQQLLVLPQLQTTRLLEESVRASSVLVEKKLDKSDIHVENLSVCNTEVTERATVRGVNNNLGSSVSDLENPPVWKSQASTRATVREENNLDSDIHVENLSVWKITRGAAQIKRAEILARAVGTRNSASILSHEEASRIRGLLLTVDDFDWRSLMLRCVACLYRLEGILEGDDGTTASSAFERTPEVVLIAREGLRVYSILAQQLGLGRLKARIEDRAFQILYRRQYQAVTALYTNRQPSTMTEKGEVGTSTAEQVFPMESVSSCLQVRIAATLFEDEALMAQLESLQVSARVKERFSFWKKLLKKKFKEIGYLKSTKTALDLTSLANTPSGRDSDGVSEEEASHSSLTMSSSNLSVSDVPDAVALRVILRARKWYENEPEETTRMRERLLCYYVQEKLRSQWPAVEPKRIKDYIQFPKPNGYQSLHYTSAIVERGVEFPFEVQVRSEEMHQIAEHGVANHWGYKLGNQSAPAESTLLLPGSSNFDDFDSSSLARSNAHRVTPSTGNSYLNSLAARSKAKRLTPSTGNSYLDSLARVRQSMAEQQVYVFVTATGNQNHSSVERSAEEIGKLVSVPANSRVDEAVRTMLEEYSANGFVPKGRVEAGVTEPKVWRNGRIARINDIVENGDVLLVTL